MIKLIARIFIILVTFFQVSIIPVSASPVILGQSHHTSISETYAYDKIESSIGVEVDRTGRLSRVLSVKEVRPDCEVLGDVVRVAARGEMNPVPSRLARVIPANVSSKTLGAPGAADVFITAADDIAGLNASQIAQRLTIPNSRSDFRIIEFNTPRIGLSSPINRTNPGFVGFGRTAGGAREFALPNQLILNGSTIRIVR